LQELQFGLAYTLRDKTRDDFNNDWTGGSSQYNFYTTPVGANPITFGSLGANVVTIARLPNYMQGAGGSFPTTVAVFDIAAQLNALRALDGQPNLYTPGAPNYDFNLTLPQFNAVNSYSVRERTTAAYFEATFAGARWSANAGLRLVHTSTTAGTAVNDIISVTVANLLSRQTPPSWSTASRRRLRPPVPTPIPCRPSISPTASADIAAAAGRRRNHGASQLNQVAPTRTDNSLNRVYQADYAGNANLKPIRSYQGDISLDGTTSQVGRDRRGVWQGHPGLHYHADIDQRGPGRAGLFRTESDAGSRLYTVTQPIKVTRATSAAWKSASSTCSPMGRRARQYAHTGAGPMWTDSTWTAGRGLAFQWSLGVLYEAGRISSSLTWDTLAAPWSRPSPKSMAGRPTRTPFLGHGASVVRGRQGLQDLPGGQELANAIARSYLNQRSDAVWSAGNTGSSSSLGQGYTAYGRSYMAGLTTGSEGGDLGSPRFRAHGARPRASDSIACRVGLLRPDLQE